MAKITGKAQTLSFAGTSVTCVTSVDYSDTADEYLAACSGSSYKVHITGQRNITATVNLLLDSASTTLLNLLEPTDAGAWIHGFTAVNTDTEIKALNAVIISRTITVPVEGLVAASLVVGLDDIIVQTVVDA